MVASLGVIVSGLVTEFEVAVGKVGLEIHLDVGVAIGLVVDPAARQRRGVEGLVEVRLHQIAARRIDREAEEGDQRHDGEREKGGGRATPVARETRHQARRRVADEPAQFAARCDGGFFLGASSLLQSRLLEQPGVAGWHGLAYQPVKNRRSKIQMPENFLAIN